mmetsp:Transcript_25023/g.68706  ORF Transcript_25023/g.68706 Transcript_25023/m.68706 type:complete len:339 (+) Transcript_25023:2354-3370(+)
MPCVRSTPKVAASRSEHPTLMAGRPAAAEATPASLSHAAAESALSKAKSSTTFNGASFSSTSRKAACVGWIRFTTSKEMASSGGAPARSDGAGSEARSNGLKEPVMRLSTVRARKRKVVFDRTGVAMRPRWMPRRLSCTSSRGVESMSATETPCIITSTAKHITLPGIASAGPLLSAVPSPRPISCTTSAEEVPGTAGGLMGGTLASTSTSESEPAEVAREPSLLLRASTSEGRRIRRLAQECSVALNVRGVEAAGTRSGSDCRCGKAARPKPGIGSAGKNVLGTAAVDCEAVKAAACAAAACASSCSCPSAHSFASNRSDKRSSRVSLPLSCMPTRP